MSDGDVRSALLKNVSLDDCIFGHFNENFSFVRDSDSREEALKQFDQTISALPVLDQNNRVLSIERSPGPVAFRPVDFARAKAPARISLAGGGTDFTKYFISNGGLGLSIAIAKYAHAVIRKRNDSKISIYSNDFKQRFFFNSLDEATSSSSIKLVHAGLRLLKPEFGFDLHLGTDFPPGAGLGGSASLLACLAGAIKELSASQISKEEIAEFAFQAERIELKIPGGWQDQYATVFGGVNFVEFNRKKNVIMPLKLERHKLQELEASFLLCYTGTPHAGLAIQKENQSSKFGGARQSEIAENLKNLTIDLKTAILQANIGEVAKLINESWALKKSANPLVTNEKLDCIHSVAMDNGALGGRLLGTGGGGYFLFVVEPFRKFELINRLKEINVTSETVTFDGEGLVSWVR